MTIPSINPTPKARYIQEASQVKHRELVHSQAFQAASDFALLEYQRLVTEQIRDQGSAMAAGLKIQGAIEFMGILRTLAEEPPRIVPLPAKALNPRV
jgi:hypothetical protein